MKIIQSIIIARNFAVGASLVLRYPDGQLRTLQRRLKGWHRDVAHVLVFGAVMAGDGM